MIASRTVDIMLKTMSLYCCLGQVKANCFELFLLMKMEEKIIFPVDGNIPSAIALVK
jgi:hypothetical protein